jgi:hypothetical protein
MPKVFGVANRILFDTGAKSLKTDKTGTVPVKPGGIGS